MKACVCIQYMQRITENDRTILVFILYIQSQVVNIQQVESIVYQLLLYSTPTWYKICIQFENKNFSYSRQVSLINKTLLSRIAHKIHFHSSFEIYSEHFRKWNAKKIAQLFTIRVIVD